VQYLEHILVGVAFLIFLGVAGVVGLAFLVRLARGKPGPGRAATIYPIPPPERDSGRHVSLLDLVDDHLAAEDRRRRRETISGKVYDWAQPTPKA
jgi:hypothetical protein